MITAILLASLISVTPSLKYISSVGDNIAGKPLNNPQGLAINSSKMEFLIADALNDRIIIVDTVGAIVFVFDLGAEKHNPFGIAVSQEDEIIVGAMDKPFLWLYDFTGNFLGEIILNTNILPGRLAVRDGSIFIVNRAGNNIIEIDRSGNFLNEIVVPESTSQPCDILISPENKYYVISCVGSAIYIFDESRKLDESYGSHGGNPEDYSHPTSADIDEKGRIWVVDSFRHQLKCLNRDNQLLQIFGRQGVNTGEYFFPVDIKILPNQYLGVLEKGSGRLQIFRIDNEIK